MTKQTVGNTKSVSERTYDIVRSSIVNLSLAPGTAMSEKEIAERLKVSRTPVRETFIKLAREGLVEIFPQKGTVVSRIDFDSALEERFLREALERAVLDKFMRDVTPLALSQMRRSIEKQRAAVESSDLVGFLDLDDQFHGIMFECANKAMCYDVVKSVSGNYRRLRFLSLYVTDVQSTIIGQHEELVAAIEKGEDDKAQDVLKKHLRNVTEAKTLLIEKYPDFFSNAYVETEMLQSGAGLKVHKK